MAMDQLFFLFLILLPIASVCSEPTPYQKCEKNVTQNNMLQANINNILFDMVAKSSLQGYAISSYATDGVETVYGLTRCQTDLSVQACSACITKAAQKIRTTCPDSTKSRIWYEECFLRYDTEDFLGKPDNTYAIVWLASHAAKNPKAFKQAVGELMALVIEATAEGSRKFSHGENCVNDKLTVYAMAQCTRDLGKSECKECLINAWEIMSDPESEDNCENQDGCRIFGSSCVIRYEIHPFLSFSSTMGEAVAPAPAIVIDN